MQHAVSNEDAHMDRGYGLERRNAVDGCIKVLERRPELGGVDVLPKMPLMPALTLWWLSRSRENGE